MASNGNFLSTFQSHIVLFDRLLQGEKYLVLKKKYRQLSHERDTKHYGTDEDARAHLTPARTTATVQWDMTDASPPQEKQRQEEPMSCGEPGSAAEVNLCEAEAVGHTGMIQQQYWVLLPHDAMLTLHVNDRFISKQGLFC